MIRTINDNVIIDGENFNQQTFFDTLIEIEKYYGAKDRTESEEEE